MLNPISTEIKKMIRFTSILLISSGCAAPAPIDWGSVTPDLIKQGSGAAELIEIAAEDDSRFCATETSYNYRVPHSDDRFFLRRSHGAHRVRCAPQLLDAMKMSHYASIKPGWDTRMHDFYLKHSKSPASEDSTFLTFIYRDIGVTKPRGVTRTYFFTDKNTGDQIHKYSVDGPYFEQVSASVAIALKAVKEKEAKAALHKIQKKTDELKERCTSFGFAVGSDVHAQCVMELTIAAEANERQRIVNTGRAAANVASEAAADEARRQRQAQALINLGSAISSGGASGRSISTPTTAPLSSGRYKTCRYRVAGEIVPMTLGRAELCPATRSIGGQTGYLVR